MSNIYRSPYEAYPFLADVPNDLRCDFEILTDEVCSLNGLLAAKIKTRGWNELYNTLTKLGELIYHANPSLRTFCSITEEEVNWLKSQLDILRSKTNTSGFVLPHGSELASYSHILRTKGKELVRMLYRHYYQGNEISPLLLDFCNLLSGYYFILALYLNNQDGVEEIPFTSRNY